MYFRYQIEIPEDRIRWFTRFLLAVMVIYGMYTYYGYHAYHAMDKWIFTEDARRYLPALFQYYDMTLANPNDYLGEMTRNTYLPLGYKVLYKLASYYIDPIVFSKFLPYLLMMAFATLMSLASKNIAGLPGFIVTLILTLSTDIFLERMVGGLPRAFAYPIAALTLWGVTANRPAYLSISAALGAAFYPAMTIIPIFLLVVLLFLPTQVVGSQQNLTWEKRITLIVFTILLSYIVFVPMYYHITQYGGIVAPNDQSEHLPDHYSATFSFIYSISFYSISLFSHTLFPFTLIVLVTSFSFACFQYPAARRLAIMTGLTFALYWLLTWMQDAYFSQRFTQFYIPVMLLALIPFFIQNAIYLLQSITQKPVTRPFSIILALGLVLAILYLKPTHIEPSTGLTVNIESDDRHIYDFIQSLPQEGLIAGWPGEKSEIIENVPYLAKHSVFFTEGAHREFFAEPQSTLRTRFKDLLNAYFATDPGPILYLRDHWNVRYLILDLRHFSNHPPTYKPAFNSIIERKWYSAYATHKTFSILNYLSIAPIFKQGPILILDLSRIPSH